MREEYQQWYQPPHATQLASTGGGLQAPENNTCSIIFLQQAKSITMSVTRAAQLYRVSTLSTAVKSNTLCPEKHLALALYLAAENATTKQKSKINYYIQCTSRSYQVFLCLTENKHFHEFNSHGANSVVGKL